MIFTVPEDVVSFSTYYNYTSEQVFCYVLSMQETQLKLYEMVFKKDLTSAVIDSANLVLVPPCGQTIKATASYILIGCPDVNERAGKIYVYLRKIFSDVNYVPFLKMAAELDGTHRNMRLGTPDSLTNSI